jgi:hypothetical protein
VHGAGTGYAVGNLLIGMRPVLNRLENACAQRFADNFSKKLSAKDHAVRMKSQKSENLADITGHCAHHFAIFGPLAVTFLY